MTELEFMFDLESATKYLAIANKNLIRCGYESLPIPRAPRSAKYQRKRKHEEEENERRDEEEDKQRKKEIEREKEKQRKKEIEIEKEKEIQKENVKEKETSKEKGQENKVTDSQIVREHLGEAPPPPSPIPIHKNNYQNNQLNNGKIHGEASLPPAQMGIPPLSPLGQDLIANYNLLLSPIDSQESQIPCGQGNPDTNQYPNSQWGSQEFTITPGQPQKEDRNEYKPGLEIIQEEETEVNGKKDKKNKEKKKNKNRDDYEEDIENTDFEEEEEEEDEEDGYTSATSRTSDSTEGGGWRELQ